MRILLIDNDLRTYTRLLQTINGSFVIQHVFSVEEAKQVLDCELPDMVISEVHMGESESGLVLCRYIRENARLRHVPVMLFTSLATTDDKVAGFEAGADDYVVKPFDSGHLIARIRLLMRIKHLERRN